MNTILQRSPQTLSVLRLYEMNLKLFKRNAGHSKWQNIKHIKAAKDAEKGHTFQKLLVDMRLAISEGGGPDPLSNVQLAHVIERAKKVNMPVSNIQKVLKDIKEKKTSTRTGNFQIKGPGRSIVIVKYVSDNIQKTKAAINIVIRKFNVSLTEGAAENLFDHKGIIITAPPQNVSEDDAVEHAIETGAEDVEKLESDMLQFTCEPQQLSPVKGKLEKLGYSITSAETEFIAQSLVQLNDDELMIVQKMYDKLESNADIVKIYDNIA